MREIRKYRPTYHWILTKLMMIMIIIIVIIIIIIMVVAQ
jgi:hypothetical protein